MARKLRWEAQERVAKRRKAHEKRKARKKAARSARRTIVAKVIVVVVVLLVLLALALVVGDSDYHATVVGWAPFVAAVVVIVLARIYLALLVHSLTFSEELHLSDCKRGRDVPFTVHFANSSPLVFFRLEASFYISDLFGNAAHVSQTTIALGPHESYDLRFEAVFEHIGTYTAGLKEIVVNDFLGLFTCTLRPTRSRQVDVTPQLQVLEQITFDDTATVETSKAAKSVLADSMDYSHVREYVPGDPLKTIHWKLSARTDTYMTRLYEVYNEPGVAVIMDFSAPVADADVLMGMFDAVVESAFSIAEFTRAKGMDTVVLFSDKNGEEAQAFSWDDEAMPGLIARMPAMSTDEADGDKARDIVRRQVLSTYGQSTLVVCSANLDSELVSAVADAKARRRSPLFIAVIPPDIDGRARDAYCKPLAQLDSAGVPYVVIARSEELGVTLS